MAPLQARSTFGGGKQQVLVRCKAADKAFNASYDGLAWNTLLPQIVVFDQGFVERNVYAGSEVNSDHHEALLEFALGSVAVKKKQEVDNAGVQQTAATKRRTAAEEQLKGYQGKTALADFVALTEDPKVDENIAVMTRRIADAKDAASIASRVALKEPAALTFDFGSLQLVLAKSLEDVHAEAEKAVKAHLAHLANPSSEQWIASGLKLLKDDGCPFCSQSTAGIGLVAAYQTYFNDAYAKLASDVQGLAATATNAIGQVGIVEFDAIDSANRERLNTWAPQLKLVLDPLDIGAVRQSVQKAEAELKLLVEQKVKTPLRAVLHDAPLQRAKASLAAAGAMMATYRTQVAEDNSTIAAFKAKLADEKPAALETELQSLRTRKTRYQVEVVALVEQRANADKDRATWEGMKASAHKELDALMADVLGSFQASINKWLGKFGAAFTVEKLKASYAGSSGAPRTEYGLFVRGASVPAGKKAAGPSFQTALSDGDKRTLALAFFLAKLFDDKELGHRIVVVDDMFTSLDKHRRSQTVDALGQISKSVAQIVVLAHDAFFLRDVQKRLTSKGVCKAPEIAVLGSCRGADDFSELKKDFDLDELCSSDYYKRYQALAAFLDSAPTEPALSVAQGLRSLLEGHLHRRFPGHIKDGLPVGAVFETIKTAAPASPLAVLQPCLPGLHELNDFAGAFHHDTDGTAPRAEVTDAELVAYGKRVMQLLHTGQA